MLHPQITTDAEFMFVSMNKRSAKSRQEMDQNMANLPLIIGAAMIIVGLGLGVFITIRIMEQRRIDRDEPLD